MKKLLIALCLKKIAVIFFLFVFVVQEQKALAQAIPVAPAANFVLNRAIGGVLTKVAVKRGFAANDPRIAATLASTGNVIAGVNVASTVAGVGLAVAGAPVWLTVAAGLGIFALGSVISGVNATIKLDGDAIIVDASKSVPSRSDLPLGLQPANLPWDQQLQTGTNIYRLPDCFPTQGCYFYKPLPTGPLPFQKNFQSSDTRYGSVAFVYYSLQELKEKYLPLPKTIVTSSYTVSDNFTWNVEPRFETSDNGIVRLIGSVAYERKCVSGICTSIDELGNFRNWANITLTPTVRQMDSVDERIIIDPIARPNRFKNLDDAIQAIPDIAKSENLSPDFLAKLVDQAWVKAASQPDYQGVPYSTAQPVTTSDVATWASENPENQPKIGDLLTPANNPGTTSVPISQSVKPTTPSQNTGSNAIQNVNIVNVPKVDLGADPNIAAPTLEPTPGGLEILYPLFTLFPELKNYQAPQHASGCPKPEFNVFGKTITMDSHCTIAEQHRLAIGSIMIVVWMLVSMFILLSA